MNYTLYGTMPIWLAKIIEGISYKPGWSLLVTSHSGYAGRVYEPDAYSIEARCTVEDVVTKNPITLHGGGVTIRKEYMDEKMVVHMIFNCIRQMECHEMEEQFNYNGFRVFDPHRERAENEKLFELAMLHPKEESAMALTSSHLSGFRRLL
jgi:hypothetical protein